MNLNYILFGFCGKKIKSVAIAWMGVGVSLFLIGGILGFLVAFTDFGSLWYMLFLAPIVMVFGWVTVWVSALMIYGFGEIVDRICRLEGTEDYEAFEGDSDKDKELESLKEYISSTDVK